MDLSWPGLVLNRISTSGTINRSVGKWDSAVANRHKTAVLPKIIHLLIDSISYYALLIACGICRPTPASWVCASPHTNPEHRQQLSFRRSRQAHWPATQHQRTPPSPCFKSWVGVTNSQQARDNNHTRRSAVQKPEEGGTNSGFCSRHHKPIGQPERRRYSASGRCPVVTPTVTGNSHLSVRDAHLRYTTGIAPVMCP